MTSLDLLRKQLPSIEEKLGLIFRDKEFLILAFIHRSFVNEHRNQIDRHNERLEFLGDSVLGLVVAELLYRRLPSYPEGQLSQLRSRLVDAPSCARFLQKLSLAEYILLGRGEQISEGRTKSSILADVFEALVGAIYLDAGISVARSFFLAHFEAEVEETIGTPARNYKAELQDYSQKRFQKTPTYRVIQESGPDHAKKFSVEVLLDEQKMGEGSGSSKKRSRTESGPGCLGEDRKEWQSLTSPGRAASAATRRVNGPAAASNAKIGIPLSKKSL